VLTDRQIEIEKIENGTVAWAETSRGAFAAVFDEGTLVIVDHVGAHVMRFDQPGSRRIAASEHSPYIAVGSKSGLVRWWDASVFAPVPIHAEVGNVCSFDDTTLYLLRNPTMTFVDRKTGAVERTIGGEGEPLLGFAHCSSAFPGALSLVSPIGSVLVDTATGALLRLAGVDRVVPDTTTRTFLYSAGRDIHELTAVSPDRVVYTAQELRGWTVGYGWLLIEAREGQLVRIHRATGETASLSVAKLGTYTLGRDGSVWYTTSRVLHRWDGARDTTIHELPADVYGSADIGDGWFGFELEDHSIWVANGDGVLLNRTGPGSRTLAFGTRDLLAWSDSQHLMRQWLITGEKLEMKFVRSVMSLAIGLDGHTIAISTPAQDVLVFEDVVPRDPARLRAWIDTATNAVVDMETSELIWR
jgi:hypothetical protein